MSGAGLWLLPLLLAAEVENPYLIQGRELMRGLKFAEALPQLEQAAEVPNQSRGMLVEVLVLLARCQIAERRPADAQKSFTRLLMVEPNFGLGGSESPKVQEVLEAARGQLFERDFFKVSAVERAGLIEVTLVDPWRKSHEVEIQAAVSTAGPWRSERFAAGLQPTLKLLPQERVWFVEARGEARGLLGSVGSAGQPQTVVTLAAAPGATLLGAPPPADQPVTTASGTASAAVNRRWGPLTYVGFALSAAALVTGVVLEVRSGDLLQQRQAEPWVDTAQQLQQSARLHAQLAIGFFIAAGALILADVLWSFVL